MGRFFWFILGAAGLVLIVLIASGDTGTTLGFETNLFAGAAVAALWAVVIGAGAFSRMNSFTDGIRQLALWCIIILLLTAGYVFRYDLQDVASRFTGGIVPGSPISGQNDAGRPTVTLVRSDNGHFEAVAGVNGTSVRFLVDTGATSIVLSSADARAVGLDPESLSFTIPVQTANGVGRSAATRVERLYLGGIERNDVPVLVAEPRRLGRSLLGQQFLESLSSYEKRGDRLILRD